MGYAGVVAEPRFELGHEARLLHTDIDRHLLALGSVPAVDVGQPVEGVVGVGEGGGPGDVAATVDESGKGALSAAFGRVATELLVGRCADDVSTRAH